MRLIGENGEQIGVIELGEALMHARDKGLDLVEVAPKVRPVVCKLMDYGRYKYEQKKQTQEAKQRESKSSHIHTVRFRPNIEAHDYETKCKKIMQFLMQGEKVKVELMLRRAQMRHADSGTKLLDRVTERFSEYAKVESRDDSAAARSMVMLLAPVERKIKELKDQLAAQRAAAASGGKQVAAPTSDAMALATAAEASADEPEGDTDSRADEDEDEDEGEGGDENE